MTRAIWLTLLAGILFVNVGCRNTCNRQPLCGRNEPAPQPVFNPPPPPQPIFPGAPIQQSGAVLPPGALTTPPPSISKSPPERVETQWQPGETREPDLRRDVPPRIQLYAPEPIDKETPKPAKESALEKKPNPQRALPAIAQFAEAQKKVYAGLRPPLDGLDWLQEDGVQTVVHIHLFGEDDSADKKQVEKRNMRYVAFEVSPEALTKEKADEFVKLIRASAKDGIFVYDQDGSLAGSMWYLHMRYGETLDDDAAQLRAAQLGLQTAGDGQHREMWLAARKLMSENNR